MSLPPERTTVNLSKERYHLQPVRFIPPNNAAFNPNNGPFSKPKFTQSIEMCPLVKEEEIFTNLMNLLQSMKDTNFIQPGENGYYTKYKWSFYETFGIPTYSLVEQCLKNNYRTLFKKFNYRGPVRTWWRGNPSNNFLDTFFEAPLDTCIFNLFTQYSYKYEHGSQPDNLFLIINWKMQNPIKDMTNYKLHFMVDEGYALYVLMKAMMIVYNRDKRKGVNIQRTGKILTDFRLSKFPITGPRAPEVVRNTVAPTIVIYTASDSADEAREMLEELLAAFPEHEEIGLMSLGQSNLIPFGNVRLNKLICYAQGDRNTKLTIKRGNFKTSRYKRLSYQEAEAIGGIPQDWSLGLSEILPNVVEYIYTDPLTQKKIYTFNRPIEFPPIPEHMLRSISTKLIPPWVTNMISRCNSSQGEINRRSQIFFGINFCDPMYSNLHSTCTVDPLCYFSVDETCLDPNTIRGVEYIEPSGEFSSALTIRSANTGRLEGGGATRGGRSSSRRRRTKNKKFKKLRRTRR